MRNRSGAWRWRNVPVPQAHVAGLVVGAALHVVVPMHIARNPQHLRVVGWTSIGAGVLLGAWAVREAGTTDIEQPSELVTTGPFAFTRNPMYVAWTALYMGIAFVVNTGWLFVLLPVVVIATHVIVKREERLLERAFGDRYRDYADDVRRYL